MKVLMVTNKVKTYALGFQNVIIPLTELGHQIVWAADFSSYLGDKREIPCQIRNISIYTNPFQLSNCNAYHDLCKIINEEKIDAVLCSTPIGGVLGRLAAKKAGIKPVVYEAHGFLFFDGAPLINCIIYKTQEKLFAHWTDMLITITREDQKAAEQFHLRSGLKPRMVHGAGVRTGAHVLVNREKKRAEIGIPSDGFLIISAGELNKNKNTEAALRGLAMAKNKNIVYAACGVGEEKERLENLAQELQVRDRFVLLGYRTDMPEIMACADAFVIMSFREGMPRALLEAMDLGLPCIGSNTRGIRDLIQDGDGGFLCDPHKSESFAEAFDTLSGMTLADRRAMGAKNQTRVAEYDYKIVRAELKTIYYEMLGDTNEERKS